MKYSDKLQHFPFLMLFAASIFQFLAFIFPVLRYNLPVSGGNIYYLDIASTWGSMVLISSIGLAAYATRLAYQSKSGLIPAIGSFILGGIGVLSIRFGRENINTDIYGIEVLQFELGYYNLIIGVWVALIGGFLSLGNKGNQVENTSEEDDSSQEKTNQFLENEK